MRLIRCILGFIIVFSIIFSLFFGFKNIGKIDSEKTQKQKEIITGWQIDTFEGGIGSRRKFLLGVASEFEKNNKDYLVMINSYSETEANEKIKKGIFPDFISYSLGVNVCNQKQLKTEYYSVGGLIGDTTYAVPWCRGGYVIISKKDLTNKTKFDKVIISNSTNNLSSVAFFEEGYSALKLEFFEPKLAYQKFISSGEVMLGTQRDVIRLENREEEYYFAPIKAFNDLYQYFSITSSDKDKINAVNQFLDLLLSEKIQNTLTKIKMFSEVAFIEYDNEVLNSMQNLTDFETVSVFIENKVIESIKDSLSFIKNNEQEEYLKIKNIIVKP